MEQHYNMNVKGDDLHKSLLMADWTWDGVVYDKAFVHGDGNPGEALRLSPHNTANITAARTGKWDLLIHVLNPDEGTYYWTRVCEYRSFRRAAGAVLGDLWPST